MGALERHVGLLKIGIARICSVSTDLGFGDVVLNACISRNRCNLLGSGVSPAQLVYGRSDFFSALDNSNLLGGRDLTDVELVRQRHVIGMMRARVDMTHADAERAISIGIQKNIRLGARYMPKIGDPVWASWKGRWGRGWRVVGLLSPNAAVERNKVLKKIPISLIRAILTDECGLRKNQSPTPVQSRAIDTTSEEPSVDLSSLFKADADESSESEQRNNPKADSASSLRNPNPLLNLSVVYPVAENAIATSYKSAREDRISVLKDLIPSVIDARKPNVNEMPGCLLRNELSGCCVSEYHAISIKSDEDSELFDPARLPPRMYLKDKLRREAIAKEVNDLLRPGKDGICPIRLVKRDSAECRGIRYIRATLVVRWKGPLRAKARLCLRGNTIHSSEVSRSPTPYRSSLKSILFLAGISHMEILCVDISQAFAQSSSVARAGRFPIDPPECLIMPRTGVVSDSSTSKNKSPEFVFMMIKPLYGLHDSPLRWFISLCTCLGKFGYRQRRMDICIFVYLSNEVPDTFVLAYVGDLMVCYRDDAARDRFLSAIRTFNTGEPELLTRDSELIFPGLYIRREKDQTISLSQKTFVSKLREVQSEDIILGGALVKNKSKIRRFFKPAMGKLLWLLQTRFDLSFQIIKSATEVAPAPKDIALSSALIKSINRSIRKAREEDHFFSFGEIVGFVPLKNRTDMRGIRIFAFIDAGYATMRGDRSVEASIIICGREVSRDGTIRCMGSIIDTYTRCILRCARSTIAAERVSCANTIELSIWHRACLTVLQSFQED